jgi:hypothetical protein
MSLIPGVFALNLYRGDTARYAFTLYDDVQQTQPSDLTHVAPRMQVRDRPGGQFMAEFRCNVDKTKTNQINAVLRGFDSRLLPMSAAWDLQLIYPSGECRTVLRGPVSIMPDVTPGVHDQWWHSWGRRGLEFHDRHRAA